jgi:hypothetical protein
MSHIAVLTAMPTCLRLPSLITCLPCSGFGIGVMLLVMVMLCCHKRLLPRLEKVRLPVACLAWLSAPSPWPACVTAKLPASPPAYI